MATHFTVSSAGARLAGESNGRGTPVVFLHAGVADRRMYARQLTELGQRHWAIAYDRRGFGETTSPDEGFSHVADLSAVLDQLEISSAVLVGCSQGGRIAADFALSNPERVAALVLVSTTISGAPFPELPNAISPLLDALDAAEEADDLARVNAIEVHLWLDGPLRVKGRVAGPARELVVDMNGLALEKSSSLSKEENPPSAYERLGELEMPVLLIHGDLDFPHVQDLHGELARKLPDARSRVVNGAAHLPGLEQPEKFNMWLSEFIGELEIRG